MNAGTSHMVGIAQMAVSDRPGDVLVAPNLGSCIGIAAYDPILKRGGVIHCLLPLSKSDPQKASQCPAMYVDTGVALLLDTLLEGCADKRRLQIVAVGGANINDQDNVFEIGKKNATVLKKILWKNGLLLKAEHVGDSSSRTLSLEIETGRTLLKFKGSTFEI